MRIVELVAENLKRLKAVQIRPAPEAPLVVIGGDNAQGKSSVLDSIWAALGGAQAIPEVPIRQGAAKARATITLDNGMVVTRSFTPKGSTLTVSCNGAKIASPQAALDALVGPISFDPVAFVRMDPEQQCGILRKALGVDTAALDARRERTFTERTAVNRDLKSLQARAAAISVPPGAPEKEVSVIELTRRLDTAMQQNNAITELRKRVLEGSKRAERLRTAVADLKQRLADAEDELSHCVSDLEKDSGAAATLVTTDVEPLRKEILNADMANRAARARAERAKIEGEIAGKAQLAEDLTAELDAIDAEKAQALAKAGSALPGLALSGDRVMFGGLPLSAMSGAEALAVSVRLALALNPKLRVLLIRDGSLLDAAHLEALARIAAESQAQVWIERVSKGGEVTVVIEDGEVVA
jgi:DNA repair exonuclease SbcCD ATPase subunit